MGILNMIRLYLTSQPTHYAACVTINGDTAQVNPFNLDCIQGAEILLLILAIISTVCGLVHLFILVNFVYTECYENQTLPLHYLKCVRTLDFPAEAEHIQLLIILHSAVDEELKQLNEDDPELFKAKTKSGDNLLHLAVKSNNSKAAEYLLKNTSINVNEGMVFNNWS